MPIPVYPMPHGSSDDHPPRCSYRSPTVKVQRAKSSPQRKASPHVRAMRAVGASYSYNKVLSRLASSCVHIHRNGHISLNTEPRDTVYSPNPLHASRSGVERRSLPSKTGPREEKFPQRLAPIACCPAISGSAAESPTPYMLQNTVTTVAHCYAQQRLG